MAKGKANTTPRVTNRKARHDYHILESVECGVVLTGSEVKSIRDGKASIAEGYAAIDAKRMELWLHDVDIAAYANAPVDAHLPKRKRKLLARKREIERLFGLTTAKGTTLIPLTLYFSERGIVKIELGVARGKQKGDKRESMKKDDARREMQKAMTRKRL